MTRPQAYDPREDCKYQIFCRDPSYDRSWDHCDYAKDYEEKKHLLGEYRLAFGSGFEFKTILLPRKYWPKVAKVST